VTRRKPLRSWEQILIVLLFAVVVLGMAWVTQYAMIKASARPRAPGAAAPK
jgi:hypothetical protein